MAYLTDVSFRRGTVLRTTACALALSLAACGDDDSNPLPDDAGTADAETPDAETPDAETPDAELPDAAPEKRVISIDFEARVGSELFECGKTYQQLGTSKASANFIDFRLYLYDVRMIDAAGKEVAVTLDQNGVSQYQDAVLLDFEDGKGGCKGSSDINTKLTGEVAWGDYRGVAFKVGLPPKLNHSDTAATPAPLDIQALTWGWNQGRTFVVVDLVTTPAGNVAGSPFSFHVGSAQCTGNPQAGEAVSCKRPNVGEVKLSTFNMDTSKIVIDSSLLLKDVAIDGPGAGCMSTVGDAECDAVFPTLGIDATGAPSAASQTVFRVVSKAAE